MKKLLFAAFVMYLLCPFTEIQAQQATAAAYKLTNLKIVPFEGTSGKFEDEIKLNSDKSFFNELSKSLMVVVEVSGKSGDYANRNVEVTVSEGKKSKLKQTAMIGILNDAGKFYVPVWLYAPMCGEVTINARITGQTTMARQTRKILFECGE
ncbi:MAG: hypothetical protein M3209_06500 [Acidobacteriota bacterium]|nr:hypothetical protein [Acidobacteriota bacterium]